MKPLALTLITTLSILANAHAEVRTFTSSTGTTLKGELVSVVGDTVTIKKEDGTPLALKLTAFSRVDQAWLQTQTTAAPAGASDPAKATKDAPFVNSLGMKFVPVPGTNVLFCMHETRRKDYAAYASSSSGVDTAWKNQKMLGKNVSEKDNDPVVGVSWEDAKAFCVWLTKKDRHTARLPTDREWSFAVGIGEREQAGASPGSLHAKITNAYPWGTWPLQPGAGNYYDKTSVPILRPKKTDGAANMPGYLDGFGYDDGYPLTAPVMSYQPNNLGIYDLGGNVWELCEDLYSPAETDITYRGSSYGFDGMTNMLSSARVHQPRTERLPHAGFRIVLELPNP